MVPKAYARSRIATLKSVLNIELHVDVATTYPKIKQCPTALPTHSKTLVDRYLAWKHRQFEDVTDLSTSN